LLPVFIETNEKSGMPRVQNGGEQGGSLWAMLGPPQVWMKPSGSNKQTQGTGTISSASIWRCHHAVKVRNEAM